MPDRARSLPRRSAARSRIRMIESPSRETYSASAKPKVSGTACWPCVRPIWGVSASSRHRPDEHAFQLAEQRQDHAPGGVAEPERRRGVQDVRRCRPEVHERSDSLGEKSFQHVDQSTDIVLCLLLLDVDLLGIDFVRGLVQHFQEPGMLPGSGAWRSRAFRRATSTRAQDRTAASSLSRALKAFHNSGFDWE